MVRVRKGLMRGAWLITLGVGWGCAPTTPAKTAEGEPVSAQASDQATPKVAPLPPLESVPAPDGVVARLRVLDPKKLSDGILDAASIPFDLAKAVRTVDGKFAFLKVMDIAGPIEGAVILNPQEPMNPSRFLSVGVVGVDEVLGELEASNVMVQEGPHGVYYFNIGRDPCAVGRSMGVSPARVVCSDRRGGLHQVLPYALRGLPNESLSQADVFAQMDFRPIRHRYKKELDRLRLLASVFARQGHVGHPKFDRALTDAAIGLADELSLLAMEAEQASLEVVEKGGSLTASLKAVFDGQASTTVQSLRAQAKSKGQAPDSFARLPSTTASAWFYRELPVGSLQNWTSIVTDLASGFAEYKGASLEFANRLSRVVKFLEPSGRIHLQARGPLVTTIEGGHPMARSAWSVWGINQPQAEVQAFLDDLGWLLASPDFKKLVESDKIGGSLKRTATRLSGAKGATVYKWSLSDETVKELDHEVQAAPGAKKEQLTSAAHMLSKGHLAVDQIDGVTYISWSMGDSLVPLKEAFAALSAKDVERLSDIPQYGPLLSQRTVGAGFFTLLGVGGELWSFAPEHIVKDLTGLMNATPYHGRIPFYLTYDSTVSDKTVAQHTLTVPREFTQDATTLAAIIFTELNLE